MWRIGREGVDGSVQRRRSLDCLVPFVIAHPTFYNTLTLLLVYTECHIASLC